MLGTAATRQLVASSTGLASATSATFSIATPFASTGADGAFLASSDTTLPARVYNFTTISIPAGVTVLSDGAGVLELRSTGDVTINGHAAPRSA